MKPDFRVGKGGGNLQALPQWGSRDLTANKDRREALKKKEKGK